MADASLPAAPPTAPPELHPPRCMSCGYVLQGLPSPSVCPECARGFDLNDPRTFIRSAPFMRWTFWGPGLLLALGIALVSLAIDAFILQAWGASLWLGIPLAAGAILGYRVRLHRSILPLIGVLLGLGIIGGAMTMQLAGVYCGLILACIFFFPIFFGMLIGIALRQRLKHSNFSQRSYLPIIFFAIIPTVWAAIEGPPPPARPIETVSTTRVIAAPIDACWDSLMFYEQVTHEPPWILKVGLARPLSTAGRVRSVGDTRTCVYNKGHITKRVTSLSAPTSLVFDVTEQQIGYERDLRLVSGSFTFTPIDANTTSVTLRSDYVPRLAPRFCWRFGERIAFHTLHDYVLEGMSRKATGVDPIAPVAAGGPPR